MKCGTCVGRAWEMLWDMYVGRVSRAYVGRVWEMLWDMCVGRV
jgi:Na+/melibiose symporter-like transporter